MRSVITFVIFIICSPIQAQDISKLVNDYTISYADTGDYSGCILITKQDSVIFENCFGFADHSLKIPNETNTKFKIGSVSKQFTAAAILILEQKGLLTTNDTLSKFFPDHANSARVTIHQLLTHTSGITDIYNVPEFNKLSNQKRSIAELSEIILNSKLEFEPGSKYQYSNGGYAVLANIIEIVSGKPYQDFLTENIFQPLKMTATGHHGIDEVVPDMAIGYEPTGYDEVKITDPLDPELFKGSGSLYSTVSDLNTWINSIKNRTLLTKASYDKFLKNYGNNYGYGISVYESYDQHVFGHDGRINGFIADYLHYNESDITVIILGNIQTGVADFFRRDVAAIVFDKDYKSSAKTIPAQEGMIINKEKILGTYAFGPGFKVYVEVFDGKLMARANEGGYSELILLQDNRYFSRTLYAYIEFIKDKQGRTIKMRWTNNDGNSFEGIKE